VFESLGALSPPQLSLSRSPPFSGLSAGPTLWEEPVPRSPPFSGLSAGPTPCDVPADVPPLPVPPLEVPPVEALPLEPVEPLLGPPLEV
jgi:hypothetical protein